MDTIRLMLSKTMRTFAFLSCIYTIIISTASGAYAQKQKAIDLVREGVELYDRGDVGGAIDRYTSAVKVDPDFGTAYYELAMCYFQLKEYKKCIDYCDRSIAKKIDKTDQLRVFEMKGSALDMLGKPDQAVKVYQQAIAKFPDDASVHYNLAITQYNMKKLDDAFSTTQKAILLRPTHTSSHMLLATIMLDQGKRIEAMLALTLFLMLEPEGKRAAIALKELKGQLDRGVKRDSPNQITISIDSESDKREFGSVEMFMSLKSATAMADTISDAEQRLENSLTTLVSFLTAQKDVKTKFWSIVHIGLLSTLYEKELLEPSLKRALISADGTRCEDWIKSNKPRMDDMLFEFKDFMGKIN